MWTTEFDEGQRQTFDQRSVGCTANGKDGTKVGLNGVSIETRRRDSGTRSCRRTCEWFEFIHDVVHAR
jgi:hypothetical protein